VGQVVDMNNGVYLDEKIVDPDPTSFCIGVAGYPEKHFESENSEQDLKYLKEKVDRGAEYIVTQLFFDNSKFFDFVKKCREIGITVPIVPGIKPISTLNHIEILPKIFHTELPESLLIELKKCKSNQDVREVGTEWGIQQCKELIAANVPCLHFYTMGKSLTTKRIAEKVF
jgi:methylenetetrahydrofolate reductase (NADPH)